MFTAINIHRNNREVAEAFALFLFFWLRRRPRSMIALSGGSTPKVLFQHLATNYAERIDWQRVHFFWGDERCVPPDHPDSNYGMTKKLLFDHINIPATNIHRIHGEADTSVEVQRYGSLLHEKLRLRDGQPVFDLILLGMGDDGHTASIFPDQAVLLRTDAPCALARHPETGQQRITLTGPVLNNAENVAFLVTGESKAAKVAAILHKSNAWQDYPAAHIAPRRGKLFWFLDHGATKGLVKGRS